MIKNNFLLPRFILILTSIITYYKNLSRALYHTDVKHEPLQRDKNVKGVRNAVLLEDVKINLDCDRMINKEVLERARYLSL